MPGVRRPGAAERRPGPRQSAARRGAPRAVQLVFRLRPARAQAAHAHHRHRVDARGPSLFFFLYIYIYITLYTLYIYIYIYIHNSLITSHY